MSEKNSTLTQDQLHHSLSYDPSIGLFTWITDPYRSKMTGLIAGTTKKDGYVQIKIQGKRYYAHRLAWLSANGEWPESEIDHINGIRNDNRLANLRSVTRRENSHNINRTKSISGVVGVSWNRFESKWTAHIRAYGIAYRLGNFSDLGDAVAARKSAKLKYHSRII